MLNPSEMTLIEAVDVLRGRGFLIGADPDPDLPFASYYLQRGNGETFCNLTPTTLKTYAAYGVPD